jgi:hypothetical protein
MPNAANEVRILFENEARKSGAPIDTSRFTFAMSQDASVAVAAIEYAAAVTDAQLKSGADMLFIHASLPGGPGNNQ